MAPVRAQPGRRHAIMRKLFADPYRLSCRAVAELSVDDVAERTTDAGGVVGWVVGPAVRLGRGTGAAPHEVDDELRGLLHAYLNGGDDDAGGSLSSRPGFDFRVAARDNSALFPNNVHGGHISALQVGHIRRRLLGNIGRRPTCRSPPVDGPPAPTSAPPEVADEVVEVALT
jgi:hypothetical protein